MKLLLILALSVSAKLAPDTNTIIRLGLEELELEHVSVTVLPLPEDLIKEARSRGKALKAHVTGNNGQYIIRMGNVPDWEIIEVLAHEMVHIQQYESGDLKVFNEELLIYKDKPYVKYWRINYDERPWEIDAQAEGRLLRSKIRQKMKR